MWPFRKESQLVTPPVDLDVPVTNPALVAAIKCFAESQDEQRLVGLLSELRRSVYLIVVYMDKTAVDKQPDSNQATIKKGSIIGVLEVEGPDGGRSLALFSDWDSIRKFTSDEVSTLVMPAKQAWSFAVEKCGAAVVNPGGLALPLDRDQVNDLARTSVSA